MGKRGPAPINASLRFWLKVAKAGPVPEHAPHLGSCWLWTGSNNGAGYGQFWDGARKVYADRWAYEQEHGPIPQDLQCDHLCRVPPCVRPTHIELVTGRENIRRGDGPEASRQRQLAKTHCLEGHPFNGENTYLYPSGSRECRECGRKRARIRARRRRHPDLGEHILTAPEKSRYWSRLWVAGHPDLEEKNDDDWPCTCGHKKSAVGESHFFGYPRPGESFDPWCMVGGCGCRKYTPAEEVADAHTSQS